MADEKRVRVVFESVGGTAAAEDASRLQESLGGVAAAEDATAESTAALRAELDRYRAQVGALQQAQQGGQAQQQRFAQAQQQASLNAIELTTKLAGAANAVQGLTSALGVEGRAAGLIGATASSTAAGAQMGAMFGPQGAVVGAILGAAIPAIAGLTEAYTSAREEAEARLESIREREIPSWEELASAIRRTAQEEEQLGQLRAGVRDAADQQGFVDEQNQIIDRHVATRIELERQRATLIGLSDTAHTIQNAWRALHDEASVEQEVEALEQAIAQQRELTRQAQLEAVARIESANALPRGLDLPAAGFEGGPRAGGGGGGRGEAQSRADRDATYLLQREYDAQQELARLRNEAEQRRLDELARVRAAELEAHADLQDELLRLERERYEEQARLARDAQADFERSSLASLQRQIRQRTEELDRETEKREQELSVFGELAGGVSRSLVTAVSAIASGAQTAEEAFKGMLASFLTSIAEQALISAMREYAEAIASFARYDFGGGAGHVAAGLAFTGVAIATGAAAGAVSAPPAAGPSQADRPDRASSDQGTGGRVVYVNNWNAPQVMAGTEADVGRTLDRLGRRAERRFGRLAA